MKGWGEAGHLGPHSYAYGWRWIVIEKWYNGWLRLLTKLLTGPHLHCVGPLVLRRFLQNLLAKYRWRPEKKFYHLRVGPLALCHVVNLPHGYQKWSQGHKARGQGQGQPYRGQTLSRPMTEKLEAKVKDKGRKRKWSPKKGLQKFFSGELQRKPLSKKFFRRSTNFQHLKK